MSGFTLRSFLFGVGAIGAVAEAIDIALRADIQLTPAHFIALGCTALVTYAMKWPTDVTASEAQEQVARARRESIAPPPELIDVPGGSHTLVPRAPRVPRDKP
jgi:hypothetical protein